VHQGSTGLKDKQSFVETCQAHDVILTSFALARLDEKLLQGMKWHRVVVDEAQNIKNPQAAQTRAILKLAAPRRLALTGTPVENRLRDLWSIFNFLNPGYLGKEAQFRKSFELPIYKDNDQARSATLKKLVEPFILRRVKTALVFTQFTEIGRALERYLEHHRHYNTYYVHGGTSVPRRDQMVTEFQDPETEPSLFILSLRAGGVGLNLTKANPVFHFDRW